MPLPAGDDDVLMPADLQKIAVNMEKNYRTGENWWAAGHQPEPEGLLHSGDMTDDNTDRAEVPDGTE